MKTRISKLSEKYPELTIKEYEITQNVNNQILVQKIGVELGMEVAGVSFTSKRRFHIP